MENDAYLEFKWKGDQCFIPLHAAFALTHSQGLSRLLFSNGQWGQTGELEVEEAKRKAICAAAAGKQDIIQAEHGFIQTLLWKIDGDITRKTELEVTYIYIQSHGLPSSETMFVESHRPLPVSTNMRKTNSLGHKLKCWWSKVFYWALAWGLRIKKAAFSWSDCNIQYASLHVNSTEQTDRGWQGEERVCWPECVCSHLHVWAAVSTNKIAFQRE